MGDIFKGAEKLSSGSEIEISILSENFFYNGRKKFPDRWDESCINEFHTLGCNMAIKST